MLVSKLLIGGLLGLGALLLFVGNAAAKSLVRQPRTVRGASGTSYHALILDVQGDEVIMDLWLDDGKPFTPAGGQSDPRYILRFSRNRKTQRGALMGSNRPAGDRLLELARKDFKL